MVRVMSFLQKFLSLATRRLPASGSDFAFNPFSGSSFWRRPARRIHNLRATIVYNFSVPRSTGLLQRCHSENASPQYPGGLRLTPYPFHGLIGVLNKPVVYCLMRPGGNTGARRVPERGEGTQKEILRVRFCPN